MAGIGRYTTIVKEIKDRLENYSALSAFTVQLGGRENRLQSGEKWIQIEYDNPFIVEKYERVRQNQKDADVNIIIWVQYPTNRDAPNNMYDANLTTGVIPLMEDILDGINTDTSDVLNPQLEDATKSMDFTIQNVIEHDSKTEFEVAVTVTTLFFTINDRGNN